MRRFEPRTAVEKSPENVADDDALRRLSASYPRARYLHLTRHPVSTQRSGEEHVNRTAPSFAIPGQPMSGIAAWVDTQVRILRFTASLPQSRYFRVRAEDVLNDPRPQLRAIAKWFEFQTDDKAIDSMMHPEDSPFASPGPAAAGIVGGHDPSFLRNPIPRPVQVLSTLERPPAWVGDSELWDVAVNLATHLGYP